MLLSLADPGWVSGEVWIGDHLWRHVSYGILGGGLEHASSLVEDDGRPDTAYRRETLRRYGRMLQALHALAQLVTDVDHASTYFLPSPEADELGRIRLDGAFAKLRTHRVAQLLNDSADSGIIGGFTRNEPLLEQFREVSGSDDRIGWQLQGRQWRLALRVGPTHPAHGPGTDKAIARAEYVAETYGAYFDSDAFALLLEVPIGQDWHRFAPDFVYRYSVIPVDTTIDHLAELAALSGRLASQFTAS